LVPGFADPGDPRRPEQFQFRDRLVDGWQVGAGDCRRDFANDLLSVLPVLGGQMPRQSVAENLESFGVKL
jgi:hypothetical protein